VTFIEVLLLIDSRNEKIMSDKTHEIKTDKFLYSRTTTGDWEQKDLPQTSTEPEFLPIEPYTAEIPVVKKKKKK